MDQLVKIKDIASEYNVSARTLRYYEEMGLIESVRSETHAYRMYNAQAIHRLQQILILRRLGISIKDIKLIVSAPGTDVVLDVLQKKKDDIDKEVAILHELKGIVLDFVRQIEAMDAARSELCNVITPPSAQEAMGYGQMDHWIPIKVKENGK